MAVDNAIHVIGRISGMRDYPAAIFATICHDIVQNGALVNAVASERELGSPSRGGLPNTTATWDGSQWRINGHKLLVSMAPALDYLITASSVAGKRRDAQRVAPPTRLCGAAVRTSPSSTPGERLGVT
jgi:alkylation response protein AidB-like acyl-CoA dehydrogenase